MKINLVILLWCLLGSFLYAESAMEIVAKADELIKANSSYTEMKMIIIKPDWSREIEMKLWSLEPDYGLVLITAPAKDKGMVTLKREKEVWNWIPSVQRVIKIPPSMMLQSWMGSDFTNDDLVKESSMLDDYTYDWSVVEDPQDDELYIELIPLEDSPVVWGKIVSAVRKVDYLPVWYRYYDEKGTLIRVMEFKEILKFGDKEIPSIMEVMPMNKKKKGNKTIVRYMHAEWDIDLDDNVFTMRNLRKKR